MAFWLLPVSSWLASAIRWVDGLGWIGPVVFIAIYVPLNVLGAPVTPFNIGAGLIFSVLWGALYTTVAATIASAIAFLLARYMLQDWVRGKLDAYPTCDALMERCEKEPWKFVTMLRLHPLLPSALKNYALGTTKIPLWKFVVASFVACTPTRVLYAYLGNAGHMTLVGGSGEGKKGISAADWWTYGIGLTVAVVLTVGLTWFVKRKLDKVKEEDDCPA